MRRAELNENRSSLPPNGTAAALLQNRFELGLPRNRRAFFLREKLVSATFAGRWKSAFFQAAWAFFLGPLPAKPADGARHVVKGFAPETPRLILGARNAARRCVHPSPAFNVLRVALDTGSA